MRDAECWIARLGLAPHPEGGWYRETYRSNGAFDFSGTEPFLGPRAHATAIYYLLETGDRSRLHRIRSDEQWFFHAGSPLEVHCFPEKGEPWIITLGPDPDEGHVFHAWVPAGCWFGARLKGGAPEKSFALVSCVVSPGFDFSDFEFADADRLLEQFPSHDEAIRELGR